MNSRSLTAGAVAAAPTALALVATPTRAEAPTPIRAACIPPDLLKAVASGSKRFAQLVEA
jgi:hypothetical protein